MPRIRDLVNGRVGTVISAGPDGAMVQWRKNWAEWMTPDKINSGRYEQVS